MVHIDWDAGHGPVTGPLNAAGASLALAYAGSAVHLSPEWFAAAAGAGLLGSVYTGFRKKVGGAALFMRAAGWLGVGGWCSWAAIEGPWTSKALAALVAGSIGLGAAIEGAHHRAEAKVEEKARFEAIERAASMDNARRKIADEWTERLQRVVLGKQVQIVGVEQWETGSGFTLDGECEGGTKWKDFKSFEDDLAADAKLPEGCGVEVGPGAHRGAVLLHVATINAFIDDVPYPDDYSELTINEPVAFGVHRDGSLAAVNLRELSALEVARRGAGKTNLMNVGLAQGCRMVDNVDWVIDLNGGGLALPWLHAWHDAGRPGKRPIDWVADTGPKALSMAEAALRIAKARKPGYKKREIAANDDKLPVGPDVPAITIRCDEIAELFSPRARQDKTLKRAGDVLVQVMELARAVAVNEFLAALRATQDVIAEPQILKQSGLRFGMQSDEAELAYLCGWSDKVSPQDIPYPGCGVMKVGQDMARPFKAYRITPQQIAKVVAATADRHPELDELSRKAAGEAYERRWDDSDHLFGIGDAPLLIEEPPEDPIYLAKPHRNITADWGTPAAPPLGPEAQSVIDQADAAKRDLQQAMNENSSRDADLERQFRDIVEGGGGIWTPPADQPAAANPDLPTPGISTDQRWPQIYAIVRQAGPEGITPEAILDTFRTVFPHAQAPSRQTVTGWLKAEPRIAQPGGQRTNYIHTDHLEN